MCPRYTSAILILALIVFVCCRNAHAGRPLVIDDAAPLSLHRVELELGVYGKRLVSDEREYVLPGIGLAYGVWPRLEIGLTLQRAQHFSSKVVGGVCEVSVTWQESRCVAFSPQLTPNNDLERFLLYTHGTDWN